MVSFLWAAYVYGKRKYWFGIGFSALLLALFFVTLDVERLFESLADANYLYIAPAVGLYLVSLLFRTLRWQLLLRHMRHVSVARLYPVVIVGYMANNLLPMRLGELVRSYYVGEREGVSKTAALVTIFIERLFDALTLLMFIAAIALFVPLMALAEGFGDRSSVPWPVLIAAVTLPFLGAFVVLLFLSRAPARSQAIANVLVRPLPEGLETRARHLIDMGLHGLAALRDARTIALLFALSAPIWLFEAGLFYLVAFSFGLDSIYGSLWELAVAVILVTAVANIGASIPAAPGGLGLFELIARETLVLLPLAAVDRTLAGAYVAVVHVTLLLPMIVLGQAILWAQHLSLQALSSQGSTEIDEASEAGLPSAAQAGGDDGP